MAQRSRLDRRDVGWQNRYGYCPSSRSSYPATQNNRRRWRSGDRYRIWTASVSRQAAMVATTDCASAS